MNKKISKAEYQRERRRIRKVQKQKQYDVRWSKGIRKVAQANRRSKAYGAPGILTLQDWQRILDVQGGKCAHCNKIAEHLDHIVSLNNSGTNFPDNIQGLCPPCHARKTQQDINLWKKRATEA